MSEVRRGLELRSLVRAGTGGAGELELSLVETEQPEPGPEQVVVRVEAAPLNPSDLGLLFGAADPASLQPGGTDARPVLTAPIAERAMAAMAGRVGQSMPVGNEGAGTVVAAGASDAAQALMGRTVAVLGGGMYAQLRTVRAADCLPLATGQSARDGASCFVNPLTALGMVETMRAEGHTALVHTAAASNLGRMLVRVCLADGIGLVNVVRSEAQAETLRGLGARHVCDTSREDFRDALVAALEETGATIAFDAIGGGRLASRILSAMETVAGRKATSYSRYGSSVRKQVYVYGALDPGVIEIRRDFGFTWGIGGWLVNDFLRAAGGQVAARLRRRIVAELTTTFASGYARTIPLAGVLDPANVASYARRSTGEKFLIDPSL